MLSSVALRARIASIIDALSKAAAAEISKVVEDDMVVLRLEMCRRESEIKKLKGSVEVLHAELRAAQDRATLRPDGRGRDGGLNGAGADRSLLDGVRADQDHAGLSAPEVQVKCEPAEQVQGGEEARGRPAQLGGELALYEAGGGGGGGPWRATTPNDAGRNDSDYLHLGHSSLSCLPESSLNSDLAVPGGGCGGGGGGFQQSPFARGLLGYSQYRNLYNTVRRRTVKRLMFKKGFICPYCGKCFERAGHLERHKRIHTGEKPYRCEVCGRRFNQKCSLKEHMKIHRRCIEPRPAEVPVGERKPTPEANPRADAPLPEEAVRVKAEGGPPQSEDAPPTPAQVKSEPTEEDISQPLPHGGGERLRGGVGDLGENLAAFERDGQRWLSRLQGHDHAEPSAIDYLGSPAQNMTSFPGLAQLLPAPAEASCSTFSFPGEPYGELKSGAVSRATYGSLDARHLPPGEAGPRGAAENPRRQRRSRSFQVIKPKKCFVCSYCGKVFERAGHLERHLRIHTGEKPYGCHVCGRCFNQKSSLKGHMKTHRNGESADVLEPHQLMLTMPDSKPPESLAELKAELAPSFEEQLPGGGGGDAGGEQAVMVKVEPDGEGFQTLGRAGPDSGTGAADRSRLWTPGAKEAGDAAEQTVCLLLGDVRYQLSVAAGAAEQRGYTPPGREPPFLDDKGEEAATRGEQYSATGTQSRGSHVTSELQGPRAAQEAAVGDYSAASERAQEGAAFEFSMAAPGGGGGGDACGDARLNCFICSSCGQSFDSFSLFQRHRCNSVTEQSFSCEMCGEVFDQMSVLKLHLELHVEENYKSTQFSTG